MLVELLHFATKKCFHPLQNATEESPDYFAVISFYTHVSIIYNELEWCVF